MKGLHKDFNYYHNNYYYCRGLGDIYPSADNSIKPPVPQQLGPFKARIIVLILIILDLINSDIIKLNNTNLLKRFIYEIRVNYY